MRYPHPRNGGKEPGPDILKWMAGAIAACGVAMAGIVVVTSAPPGKSDHSKSGLAHVETFEEPGSQVSGTKAAEPLLVSDRKVPAANLDQNPWRSTFDKIAAMESDADRDHAINTLVSGLEPEALLSALRFLSMQEPDGWTREITRRMIHHLAEIEPVRAASEVEGWPDGAGKDQAMEDVAIVWANRNAAAAAQWVKQWPDAQRRDQGMTGVAYEVARGDAPAAMTMAVELAPGQGRDDLISHVAAQWTASDPKAAVDWAGKIPDPALRARVSGTVAMELADHDPVAAATMAVTQLPIGKLRDDTVIGIVERWVQVDPKGAQAWVQQFPSGPIRATAMDNLAKLWPDRNLAR
ncbi:MAG TPA: hypothetical protein VNB29_08965 [Chthoniobacterales bacterium]|nr:hypothetical protein [Chthoniobacterales bacterium]